MQNSPATHGFARWRKTATIGERGMTLPVADRRAWPHNSRPRRRSYRAEATHELSVNWGFAAINIRAGVSAADLKSGDRRRAADVELRRVSGDMAGTDAHRRGRCTGQFTACRRCARAFDKNRGPKILDRRCRPCVPRRGDPAALAGGTGVPGSADSSRDFAPLEPELASLSGEPLTAAEREAPPIDATALYIYTSGTTGLPKAAKVSHYRLMQWSHWFAGMMDTKPQDRMFNCLPLYHSVGGVVATFATLVSGGAVVIRPRFSASDFWRDVRDERCTLFQYIGELCRYLVNTPHQPSETEHSLRMACGNGLRPEVWVPFQARFKIPRILEYYASTEGNFSLYNCEGQPGAIGRIPAFLANRLPVALLRFDVETSEPWRNAEGFCERCAAE